MLKHGLGETQRRHRVSCNAFLRVKSVISYGVLVTSNRPPKIAKIADQAKRSEAVSPMSPKTLKRILTFKNLLIYYLSIGKQYPPAADKHAATQIFNRALAHTKNLSEIISMKKIIALVAIIASAQASAWWGNGYNGQNNGYGYGNGYSNGVMDGAGDAHGEGTFSMNFSGKGSTNMRGYGNGYGAGDGWGRGYNYQAPAYYGYAPYGYAPAPVAPVAPAEAK